MIILQHCCPACGAGLALAHSKEQLPNLTDDLTPERYEQAKEEAISAGLQFIEAEQGSVKCAKCQTPVDPISLLTDWKEPEE